MSTTTLSLGDVRAASSLLQPFVRLASFVEALRRARAAAAEFERLNAMSAAGLARMGLAREDIARHVMRHFD